MRRFVVLNILSFFMLWLLSCSVSVTIPHTQQISLTSKYTKTAYTLHMALPRDYKKDHPYHIIFLLDDTYAFRLTSAIAQHLQERAYFEPIIVVGIAYSGSETQDSYRLNRTRDYTPWKMLSPEDGYGKEYTQASGGAVNFQLFLDKELFPKLEQNYRIKSKALLGHSLGGLFSVFDLLTQRLFDTYLIISPSLWYNKSQILTLWQEYNPKENLPKVFFAAGAQENRGHNIAGATQKFYKEYAQHAPESRLFLAQGLDHSTIVPAAITEGLIYLYKKLDILNKSIIMTFLRLPFYDR